MSFSINLPPGLNALFAGLVRGAGEAVEVVPQATGQPVAVRASVQTPMIDNLMGDAYQEGFVVYISPLDLPVQPEKFDRIVIRGESRSIESCSVIEANGVKMMWMLRVLG